VWARCGCGGKRDGALRQDEEDRSRRSFRYGLRLHVRMTEKAADKRPGFFGSASTFAEDTVDRALASE
jgi:hypothetical protein